MSSNKVLDVQQTLASISSLVEESRGDDQTKRGELADQLRSLLLRIKGDIDENHEALYAAVAEAASSLGIDDEPDVGITLSHIQAEIRRSAERREGHSG